MRSTSGWLSQFGLECLEFPIVGVFFGGMIGTENSFANGAREFINPVTDRALLLQFAATGEKQALVIAGILSASNSGFWDLAFEILERFPASEEIREVLSRGAQRMGEVSVGFSGPGIALSEIESKLQGQLTPTARAWLEDLAVRLRQHVRQLEAFQLEQRINR
jgi:hypothetical protein